LPPSSALAAIIGPARITRDEAIRKLLQYGRENKLTTSGSLLRSDMALLRVLKKPVVAHSDLSALLNEHLS